MTAPMQPPYTLLRGGPGSGKSTELISRAVACARQSGHAAIVLASPWAHGARALRERFASAAPSAIDDDARYIGTTLERVALDVLADAGFASGLSLDLRVVEDGAAERLFARAARPLFSLDWEAIASAAVDPEIPGLRAPERFAAAALRLIHKLRDAAIDPDAFLGYALRGATAFYATPPNFANPALLFATKEEYRDSLRVDGAELERQRRREVDLAQALALVYRGYLAELAMRGVLTRADATVEAARVLDEIPALRERTRARIEYAFVDDGQDMSAGDVRFLEALFGSDLSGVVVAGDPDQATRTFAGARPERLFQRASVRTMTCAENETLAPEIRTAADAIRDRATPARHLAPERVAVHRAPDKIAEAIFVANRVAAFIANGTAPEEIAVLGRTLRTSAPFEDALVAANVRVAYAGDLDLMQRADVLDGLAVLWTIADPFRHDHLLRALQLPTLRLADATLALLCGEPPDPQALLFDVPGETPDANRRWDRRRDVRLATNFLRGDRDRELGEDARARIVAFRSRRAAWASMRDASAVVLARRAFAESGLRTRDPRENDATFARRQTLLDLVIERIDATERRDPTRTLHDVLTTFEALAADAEPWSDTRCAGAVTVGAIEAVKGAFFAHVCVTDVRAGAFPPYYVPDAFLFSPKYGMIPKDNVGDARASRTAKFTWYAGTAKLTENYGKEARRLLYCGITRATASVLVSASGRATRGASAPEFVAELEGLGIATAAPSLAAHRADGEREMEIPPVVPVFEPRAHAPMAERFAGRLFHAQTVAMALSCSRCAREAEAVGLLIGAENGGGERLQIGSAVIAGSSEAIARLLAAGSDACEAALDELDGHVAAKPCAVCDS